MAPFLQNCRRMRRFPLTLPPLIVMLLLAGCGAEEPPRLGAAGPRPAKIPRREAQRMQAGAVLAAAGRQTYQGPSAFRCVLHEEEGFQINFRTGDPEMPTVAVRVEDYRGQGPHPARLFVTGRSRTGALVTSVGEANLELRRRQPAQTGAVVLLSGSFTGAYRGPAGRGSVEGRFDSCSFSVRPDGSPPPERFAAAP